MPEIRSATPILYLDSLEPALDLWKRLGFERAAEVRHGDALGFVILNRGEAQVMLQTTASVREDDARVGRKVTAGGSAVYLDVADLAEVEAVLRPDEVLVPRRTTFYGADEVYAVDPAGNVIGLAQTGSTA